MREKRMPRLERVAASSLCNVKRESHRAMSRATEHRAVPHEISRSVRREGKLSGFAFVKFCVQVQFLEFQPMGHIFSRQYEDDGLALFQNNFCWSVSELFYRNLNTPRSIWSWGKSRERE